jgi:hypothetical protein
MTDTFGDSWNGATYDIYDDLGNLVISGAHAGGPSSSDFLCLATGCYSMDVGGGTFDSEVGWTLVGIDNGPASGGAPVAGFLFGVGGASCVIPGCTDSAACNFNALATQDDGSCVFPGCTDAAGCNFDAAAGCDDGSCTYPGCTNGAACNFDAAAGCDDGTCCFDNCVTIDMTDTFGDGWNGANYDIYDELGNLVVTGTLPGGTAGTDFLCLASGCYSMDVGGGGFDSEIGWVLNGVDNGPIAGGAPVAGSVFSIGGATCVFLGCTDPLACNYDPVSTQDDGSCTYPGCNNPVACNFDPAAGCDDGSCTLPGCTDVTACFFDTNAGCDDGSCEYPSCTNPLACNFDPTPTCGGGVCSFPGCDDSGACNYNPFAGCNDGTCIYPGCVDPTACDYDPTAGCDSGVCDYSCYGCTDPLACNFNPASTNDDGSCDYSCYGCTDPAACNFNPGSTIDDGSCEFLSCACPADLNDDGIVNIQDVLLFLAVFGCSGDCPVGDLDGDNQVSTLDLLIILSEYGNACI